ncbi:uncharacterized protein CC84DRAFT_1079908 [Paraphaeosphaeria sporulosa]|uniref:Adhesin domain-containing protein n=1 Tax=Paraphaeosphaeria sporulosa TaxID=1460663 RepID=A0A177CWK4_9PLEO|nr:uncharacterized protein CC84DRAFT_1079908 [Paraphaeosphaeria sporulosa]OAG11944.1 hypothetical protein CC84DRAFT_1079908 [Paraphaeosphaeria sporulosa]
MYIDTEAANQAAKKPQVTISSPARYPEERTPLLETFVGQDAPPSYLEATTPMGWREEGVGLLNEERAVLTPMREEGHKDGRYRRREWKEIFSRKRVKWSGALLAAILLIVVIAALAHRDKKSTVVTPPAQPVQSGTPISKPTKGKESFPIRWPAACGKKNYNIKTEERAFGKPSQLDIVEAVHQLDGPWKRVSGWIHVVQAPAEQAAGTIEARMSYAASQTVDVDSIKYSWTSTGITIGDPSFPDGFDGLHRGESCLGISVVIYMAAGATLENFNVQAIHMGMQIHEGVNFSVTNGTSITLTTGTLDASSFNSRETRLETISGSISGKYSLLDLLSIVTKSGSVNINVDPKEKAADGPSTALFYASTMSGSIRVDTERKKIPERDYVVSINSTAGSIDGTFIHGTKTDFSSVAGGINVDLIPYSADGSSILTTKTTDGETRINLRATFKAPATAMSKLVSTHTSVSGSINLTYPQEWEGHLEGQSVTGVLHVQGKDLELIRQEERPGLNRVEAKKGNGGSTMVFKTLNGGCDVLVGKKR